MSVQKNVRKGQQPPKSLLGLIGMMLKQAPRNLLRQIPWMILMSGFTWVFHTYLLVFINEGFDVSGASRWVKAALSGSGSQSGILFWTVMAGIVSFGFSQLKQNGLGGTFKAIGTTPGWIAGSFKGFSSARLPLLLGSLGAGLLVMSIANSPLYAFQLGLLLIGEWLAQGKGLFGMVLPLGWSDMQKLIKRPLPLAPFKVNWLVLIMAGLSVSAFCGLIFPTWLMVIGLVGVIVLAVIVLITRPGKPIPGGTAALLAMLLTLGWLGIKLTGVVSADDGGWIEAGGTFSSWISSEGAGLAVGFGFFPSLGAALGWLFGATFAGLLDFPTLAEPETSSVPDWVADPEVRNAVDAWQKELDDARRESEKYRNQWDQVKDSYDVNDPNYQKLKDQYTNYINYQNQRAAQAQDQIDQMLTLEASAQQEERYKNAYDQHREENAAFIDEQRHKLETRDTAFDHEMDKTIADNKEKMEQLIHLQKIRREATDRSQKAYGETGEDDPVFKAAGDKADELIDNMLSGKEVTDTDIEKVGRVIKDRVVGASKQEGEEELPSNMDVLKDTVTGSVRTAFTGTNPDGSTNLAAIGTRIALAVGTEGVSEWAFTPINMTYSAKDAIDRGASDNEALLHGVGTAAFDYLMGKGLEGSLWIGGKVLSLTGKAAKYLMPGTAKTVSRFVSNSANKISKFFRGLKGPKPIPTAELDAVNRTLQNALRSGDEKTLLNLYRNGGMKNLAKLEELGHISPEAAQQLNKTLSKAVDEAIDTGTKNSMKSFQNQTGVKIKRTLVGDSGSSAKGGPRSVRTDFDRTTVPEFDPKSLNDYAAKNGISPAEAEKRLKSQFSEMHENEIDKALKEKGMTGGAEDVDYKTYNGIGSDSGQGDSYSYGFTSQRQTVQGKTKIFKSKPDGTVHDPIQTSGESLVDADGLQKARISGKLPEKANMVTTEELPSIISQQAKSANSHNDVKSLAKALGRTENAARPLKIQNANAEDLSELGKQLRGNPQQVNEILDGAGMTESEFVEKARSAINEIHDAASNMNFK